jgi:hypothetical protein
MDMLKLGTQDHVTRRDVNLTRARSDLVEDTFHSHMIDIHDQLQFRLSVRTYDTCTFITFNLVIGSMRSAGREERGRALAQEFEHPST